jgi:predicted amidohydrolase
MLKIVLSQLTSIDNIEKNLQEMMTLINESMGQHSDVDLILFPENCLYLRVVEGEQIPFFKLNSNEFKKLQELAKKYKVTLHLGSVPLQLEGQIFNSSVWIFEDGRIEAGYQKMHLFDIHLEGQKPIRESDVFSHGVKTNTVRLKDWKIGESICYDLRFSELYSIYAKAEVDAILIPASFLVPTGIDHWLILTRARAIESQCYVLASAQGGRHVGKNGAVRETFGHSLAISPWGKVLVEFEMSTKWQFLELNKSENIKVRQQIPMKSHRRS